MAINFAVPKIVGQLWGKSRIPDFLEWWKFELVACLPPAWQARVSAQPAKLVLTQAQDASWSVARVKGDQREAERPLDISDVGAVRRVMAILETLHDQSADRKILALPADRALRKRLSFRQEIEPNLRSALEFEMDKNTPFKADQVYFDWQVVRRDTQQRMIHVDVVVAKRELVDGMLATLKAADIHVDAVDLSVQRGKAVPEKCIGVNLMPSSQRVSDVDPQASMRWILAFALAGLIGLAMWQSLQARHKALEHLQARTTRAQAKALEVVEATQALRKKIEGANFLVNKRNTDVETVKVLLELTQLIPNDTYVERITFSQRSVSLYGQSSSAEKLIAILENAKYVKKPQFQGVIQPDPGTGKERFSLQLELRDEAAPQTATTAPIAPAPSAPAIASTDKAQL